MNLISGRDIVVIGLQAWDVDIGSNCKNIAYEFAKHNRVLYVNYPLDIITLLRERHLPRTKETREMIRGRRDNLRQVAENIYTFTPARLLASINWIKSPDMFDRLNRFNNKRYAAEVKDGINRLGMKNVILFNDNDIFRPLYFKEYLNPALSVYYSRDNLVGVNYWKLHGERLEPLLIAKSDLCVANSTYLAEYCRKYNPNSFYVGQGCELDIFDEDKIKDKPEDMKNITGPVVGYVGALNGLRLDIKCIEYFAGKLENWSVVLVGPEDDNFMKSSLHNMKNVYFLGRKDASQLPGYIKYFDVCINPQVINPVTIGNYPRKIDEYLAMGKPVVATKTEAMSVFAGHTYLAENNDDYVRFIAKAKEENSAELASVRKAFAREHTWEKSTSDIYAAIETVTKS
ncbi:MAG: glycosyltransferase [Ignavibacteriaceae bacterium]|nr:glycosyltransferase [Ignavibacteriaceae bacterium]